MLHLCVAGASIHDVGIFGVYLNLCFPLLIIRCCLKNASPLGFRSIYKKVSTDGHVHSYYEKYDII